MKLSALAVDNLPLLHAMKDAPEDATIAGLARDLGRDQGNFSKTLKRLREEGIVGDGAQLTDTGRAVTRLLGPDGEVAAGGPADVIYLPHDAIEPDPDNERRDFDGEELDALRASILMHGLIQPIVVSPPDQPGQPHRIIAGERRWRAIGLALAEGDQLAAQDRQGVRCVVRAGLTPRARAFLRLSENLQRADLHPLDEGAAYQRLVREPFNIDTDEIADEIGKSQRHVQNRIAVYEKLADDDKARMRLPADDADRLTWRGALAAIQTHKPRPAIALSPQEALVLLEMHQRFMTRPAHSIFFPGADGWMQPPKAPSGEATINLIRRDLIATAEHDTGAAEPIRFARILWTPDLKAWLAERGDLYAAIWSARCTALDSFAAGELERLARCATPWLNADLPPAEPPPHIEEDDAPERETVSPASPELAAPSPQGASPPTTGSRETAPVELAPPMDQAPSEAPLSPPAILPARSVLIDLPHLTPAQAAAMAEVCAKIAAEPQDGPRDAEGKPAFIGAAAFDYFKAADASALLAARLIGIKPDARRRGYLACLSALGESWADAHGGQVAAAAKATGTPWNTPWLNPAKTDEGAAEDKPKVPGPLGPMLGDSFARQMAEARESRPFVRLGAFDLGMVEAHVTGDGAALTLKLDEWPFKLSKADVIRLRDLLSEAAEALGPPDVEKDEEAP